MKSGNHFRHGLGAAAGGPWRRYVALGDSITEGLWDLAPDGRLRGWADRLAEILADAWAEPVQYANLAVRGSVSAHVHDEQLPVAMSLDPDLVSVVAGVNDLLRPWFDLRDTMGNLERTWARFREAGVTVVTWTFPDMTSAMLLPAGLSRRLPALNDAIRAGAARHGVLLADIAADPVALHPRLWAPDRLHGNELGHSRIASAVAQALGVPGSDDAWRTPLSPDPVPNLRERLGGHLGWTAGQVLPWLLRVAAHRDFRENCSAKHTAPVAVRPATPVSVAA